MRKVASPTPERLLLELLNIPSPSYHEAAMISYVMGRVPDNLEVLVDSIGNLFVTVGKADSYVLLNAHMDTVQSIKDLRNYFVREGELGEIQKKKKVGKHIGYYNQAKPRDPERRVFFSPARLSPIGGDDKCGVAIVLGTIMGLHNKELLPFKAFFSVQEEVGLIGASQAVKNSAKWFEDVAYSLTFDRKGNTDLVNSICGKICSTEFETEFLEKVPLDYKTTGGGGADASPLSKVIDNCVNMSVGYWMPHSAQEFVDVEDWKNVFNAVPKMMALSHAHPKPTIPVYTPRAPYYGGRRDMVVTSSFMAKDGFCKVCKCKVNTYESYPEKVQKEVCVAYQRGEGASPAWYAPAGVRPCVLPRRVVPLEITKKILYCGICTYPIVRKGGKDHCVAGKGEKGGCQGKRPVFSGPVVDDGEIFPRVGQSQKIDWEGLFMKDLISEETYLKNTDASNEEQILLLQKKVGEETPEQIKKRMDREDEEAIKEIHEDMKKQDEEELDPLSAEALRDFILAQKHEKPGWEYEDLFYAALPDCLESPTCIKCGHVGPMLTNTLYDYTTMLSCEKCGAFHIVEDFLTKDFDWSTLSKKMKEKVI